MAAAWVFGEFIAQFGQETGILFCLLMELAACVLSMKLKKWEDGRKKLLFFLPFLTYLGMVAFFNAQKSTRLDQYFARFPDHTKNVYVQGTITDIRLKKEQIWIYLTKNRVVIKEHGLTTRDVILSIEKEKGKGLKIGNKIEANGDVVFFDEATNPGQFHAKKYYRALKIDYLIFGKSINITSTKTDFIHHILFQIRTILINSISRVCKQPISGIFQSVLLGDKSILEEDINELFQDSGISHILAVSGLHISIIGLLFYQGVRRISGSFPVAGFVSFFFFAGYGYISGSSISAIRAILMFSIYAGANVQGRVYDMASSLSCACICILFYFPLQLFQSGFQLSFLAVMGIALGSPMLNEWYGGNNKRGKAFLFSLSIQLYTLPILAYNFYQYPIYAIFVNSLILPLAPLLLMSALFSCLTALASIAIGKKLAAAGWFIVHIYNKISQLSLCLPGACHIIGKPGIGKIVIYYALLMSPFLWIKGRKKEYAVGKTDKIRKRISLIVIYVLTLFVWIHPLKTSSFEIVMLDVGQGDGIFIRHPDNLTIFIDGGSSSKDAVGERIITPFLYSKGIAHLDYVIITHSDMDHTNGIAEIIMDKRISIGKIFVPAIKNTDQALVSFINFIRENEIAVEYLEKGMELNYKGLQLSCLHPTKGYEIKEANDSSIVLQLIYQDFSMLFNGDITEAVEAKLTDLKQVDILKVAHHGSKYSTNDNFLESVRPKYAWISCGKNNIYGHPHQELLQRLENMDVKVIQTKDAGAIIFKMRKNKWSIATFLNRDIDKKE